MSTLAKRYGVSSMSLARVCRRLLIPVPGRGYWSRKQAPERLPLPPTTIPVATPSAVRERPRPVEVGSEKDFAQIARLEAMATPPLSPGLLSHPLILQARQVLEQADANKQGILTPQSPCLDIRVSPSSLDRAISIMAGIIALLEAEGFVISDREGEGRQTVATIYGERVRLVMTERAGLVYQWPAKGTLVNRVCHFGQRQYAYVASGKLTVEVSNLRGTARKRWRDEAGTKIEEQTAAIVAGLIRIAILDRAEAA